MTLPPEEQAKATLKERNVTERTLAEKYSRVFGSADGKDVLADLLSLNSPDQQRFPLMDIASNPLGALMSGIRIDGAAQVTRRILDKIAEAKRKPEPDQTIKVS
jgi:hypothetical protein